MSTIAHAYENWYYVIHWGISDMDGTEIHEFKNGYEAILHRLGIGEPKEWLKITGKDINKFALTKHESINPMDEAAEFLCFSPEGLDTTKLGQLNINMGDRWFDDIVDMMSA